MLHLKKVPCIVLVNDDDERSILQISFSREEASRYLREENLENVDDLEEKLETIQDIPENVSEALDWEEFSSYLMYLAETK